MHPFFLKSLLSLIVLASGLIGIITAFEIFGRTDQKFNLDRLRSAHRTNGIVYMLLCLSLSYLCLGFLLSTKAEPSVRVFFHSFFAIFVLLILCFKILVVRRYRHFYARLQTAGLILASVSLFMVGTSAGYYLLITRLGTDIPAAGVNEQVKAANAEHTGLIVKTDPESIQRGKDLYEEKCSFCHDPLSNRTLTGPGHKQILKNPVLPVSGRPATPESIAAQIRSPYRDMPSFSHLTGDEIESLIAYLNTL